MEWIETVPAYGRDYTSAAKVKSDWNANKDFRIPATGQYVNKEDAQQYGLSVIVRYNRLTMTIVVQKAK